jgi:hypothetical protein
VRRLAVSLLECSISALDLGRVCHRAAPFVALGCSSARYSNEPVSPRWSCPLASVREGEPGAASATSSPLRRLLRLPLLRLAAPRPAAHPHTCGSRPAAHGRAGRLRARAERRKVSASSPSKP